MHKSAAHSLSNARLRVLEGVQALGGTHVTIAQLTEHLGGHPNASRPHLTALAHGGYITVADIPGEGPGRRPRGHSVTDMGRHALSPTTPDNLGLAGAFASYLVSSGHGADTAREVGRIWGEKEAESLDESTSQSVDAVVEVLDILGFDPARLQVPDGQALVLRSCPLLQANPSDTTFICDIHHGLIDGVLRRIGASKGITLLPFAEENGCRVELDDATPAQSA